MITLSLETMKIFFNITVLKETHPPVHPFIDPLNFYFTHTYHVEVSIIILK